MTSSPAGPGSDTPAHTQRSPSAGGTADGARRRPARRSRLLLLLLLLAFLAGGAEVALRVLGVTGDTIGIQGAHQERWRAANLLAADHRPGVSYINRPSAQATIQNVLYAHDKRGRRITPGTVNEDAPAVVFLGDSTTYGLGVRPADTLVAQVHALLGGTILPLNLGVCGYGTAQEGALFLADAEQVLNAPLVVLVFFANDCSPATWRWDDLRHYLYYDPLPVTGPLEPLLWSSALYRGVASLVTERQRLAGRFDVTTEANISWSLDEISALAAAVAARGARLLVAHLPALETLDPYRFENQRTRLEQRCAELGVGFVDLLPAFLAEREAAITRKQRRSGKPVSAEDRRNFLHQYWLAPEDPHPDAAGYAIAARPLAAAVAEQLGL